MNGEADTTHAVDSAEAGPGNVNDEVEVARQRISKAAGDSIKEKRLRFKPGPFLIAGRTHLEQSRTGEGVNECN